jgi:hypothetical protein
MPKIVPMYRLKEYINKWTDFKDAFPKKGTLTIQRQCSASPPNEWTRGEFWGHPKDTHNPDFIEYTKTAQWMPKTSQFRRFNGLLVIYDIRS